MKHVSPGQPHSICSINVTYSRIYLSKSNGNQEKEIYKTFIIPRAFQEHIDDTGQLPHLEFEF